MICLYLAQETTQLVCGVCNHWIVYMCWKTTLMQLIVLQSRFVQYS